MRTETHVRLDQNLTHTLDGEVEELWMSPGYEALEVMGVVVEEEEEEKDVAAVVERDV